MAAPGLAVLGLLAQARRPSMVHCAGRRGQCCTGPGRAGLLDERGGVPHADRGARRGGGGRRACLPGAPCIGRGTKTLNSEPLIWGWLKLIVEHGAVEAGGAPAFQARPGLTEPPKCTRGFFAKVW